jgi:hypothetical protein
MTQEDQARGPGVRDVAGRHRGRLGRGARLGGYLGGAYREGWARILGCLAAMTEEQS